MGRSGFFLLADALRDEQGLPAFGDALGRDGDLAHVVAARQVEHDVGHHLFENGAEAAGAGAALNGLLGDRLERVLLDREPHVLELEQLLVLLGQDRKSTRLNSSHLVISYAVFCLKKKKNNDIYT